MAIPEQPVKAPITLSARQVRIPLGCTPAPLEQTEAWVVAYYGAWDVAVRPLQYRALVQARRARHAVRARLGR
ncbi:hypothetical protein GZ998_02660 [Actinomyces sp. 594]|uniref:hypothetical protein n=1 Tax=Actinomyces sp. 594 TaxID=2057793 RepID=UPI001C56B3FD|nr:hypothetical protein [Actinomyces sp. 594]MBW3068416.1 hypothetical protein [Actinomyces sp. 594]